MRFPTYRFDNNAQGKFILNIIFGQSKYYVDNLSENTKRGIREKLRRGEYPGFAPLGYKNNTVNHTIEIDPEVSGKVKELFELYATGRYSLDDLRKLATASGLASRRKRGKLSKSNIERLLKNPFYYGAFVFKGQLYEGTHPPIITKELFDKVQKVFNLRSKPRKNGPHYHVFRGFIRCGKCGGMITSEIQKQKYIYYRCTKKKGKCDEPFLREEVLVEQINEAIKKVSIENDLKNFLLKMIDEESTNSTTSFSISFLNNRIGEIDKKLNILLDAYLNQVISEEEYKKKESSLLNEKLEIKEKLTYLESRGKVWLELARNFVISCGQASYIATKGSLEEKREFFKKIGSNFRLSGAKLLFSYNLPYSFLVKNRQIENWGGRGDLNPQPPEPQSGALAS